MKVGFIGLGMMGGGMSMNLRHAEHDMTVFDLNKDIAQRQLAAGCNWAESPKQVAEASEIVFTSLPGPPEVEAVALGPNGLLEGLKPGSVWCDLSTNSPTLMRRLHGIFAEKGIHILDTPVSGGPQGAASGKMAIWVGGDESVFNDIKPVLDDMGDQVKYIGPIGAGSIAKLVHNCAGYAVQTALAECFTMGVKAGVDPLNLYDAIRQGAGGRRRTFDGLAGSFMQNKFDPPSFALRLAHKDVRLATELGREVGVPMRLANMAYAELTEAMNRGWGHLDSRVAMVLQRERAGVEIEVPAEAIEAVHSRA
ncbi:MAG TPA: NAD(P)-dependent oxidoreductase [Dehalococcoidia bacterium]|nr:NAD(P)-dependent oxidoreductase [Dehalococcoidia bacterium]